MKPMSDRKMDMKSGKPHSEGFFPEDGHSKKLQRPGELRKHKYPDTEEEIYRDQEQFVREANKGMQKPGFRH